MKIDRDAELFGCLPKRPILLLVQVLAVRLPVHHGSTKSEFGHAAPELGDGGLSILKWESGKPGKAVGMFLNPLGKNVVHAPRHVDRPCGIWIELNAAEIEVGLHRS